MQHANATTPFRRRPRLPYEPDPTSDGRHALDRVQDMARDLVYGRTREVRTYVEDVRAQFGARARAESGSALRDAAISARDFATAAWRVLADAPVYGTHRSARRNHVRRR